MATAAASSISNRRLLRDLKLLSDERDALAARGIYVRVDEGDMRNIDVLIVPKHKRDCTDALLVSPYTGGFFLFKIRAPDDFPLSPPSVTFHPQQSRCRLHPNYYENGKVCLSIINTFGSADWSPAMSLMALVNTLEERFNERGVCFEPSQEAACAQVIKTYNAVVEYGKLKWAVINVMRSLACDSSASTPAASLFSYFAPFAEDVRREFRQHYAHYLDRLASLEDAYPSCPTLRQYPYGHAVKLDVAAVLRELSEVSSETGIDARAKA